MIVTATYDIDNAKVRALRIITVLDVLMAWKHYPNGALLQKIQAVNLVALLVHILVYLDVNRLQYGTEEGNEGMRLAS